MAIDSKIHIKSDKNRQIIRLNNKNMKTSRYREIKSRKEQKIDIKI